MTVSPPAAPPGRDGGDVDAVPDVELTVPADGSYLTILRTAAAALAARLDFTLDEVEDLRMAVDEAAALLLQQAPDDGVLRFAFRLGPDALRLRCEVETDAPRPPRPEGFAWMVLSALATSVEVHRTPSSGATGLAVDLVHSRGEATDA